MIDRDDPLYAELREQFEDMGLDEEGAELAADEAFETAVENGYGEEA